jgi:hypothetical protein
MHSTLLPMQALQRAVVSCSSLRSLPASPDLLPSHWATDFFLAATCLELQVRQCMVEGRQQNHEACVLLEG